MPFSVGIGIQCEVPSLAVADCTKRLYRTFEILDRNHRSLPGSPTESLMANLVVCAVQCLCQ